jgi:hypothetical protein
MEATKSWEYVKPTKMTKPAPVFLKPDIVLTEQVIAMVQNAYVDHCKLSEGNSWPADVRYAKREQFVIAPVVAAFATAMATQPAEYGEQRAVVARQRADFAEKGFGY